MWKTNSVVLSFALSLLPLAPACKGKESPEQKRTAEKVVAEPSPADEAAQADWSGRPLRAERGVVDGIAFTVLLPDRLEKEERAASDAPGYVTWETSDGNPFVAPTITVQPVEVPPEDPDAAARSATLGSPGLVVARKEALPDGGILVSVHEPNQQFLEVTAYRKAASGKVVRCTVVQRTSAPIPNFAAQHAWAEKVVLGFTLE